MFFTGAGISYPAGLPGFGDLVAQVYSGLSRAPEGSELESLKAKQYDSTLGLLSDAVGSMRVRREVARILMPKRFRRNATSTHEAVLTLARDGRGSTRLITTNFDRLFEKAIAAKRLQVTRYCAPLLPVPKASSWNGLVYLHGLLPGSAAPSEFDLDTLVLTSGDFGVAYLTERWAARFAGELFRNFLVCFIGYSIADPVLRYMMDALAADRRKGEGTPQAYAFGGYTTGERDKEHRAWSAKGVIPILYEVPVATRSHAALHSTLAAWAQTYRDGVAGREQLITRYAVNPPGSSTEDDNFAGRIVWAVSHPSGLPARLFAELDPVPPLSWLSVFESTVFKHEDLPVFKVTPDALHDPKLRFSLVRRPTTYKLAARMSLFDEGRWNGWDLVMDEIARWLTRHLDDRDVILLVADNGGRVHPNWSRVIERHLATIDDLAAKNAEAELARLRANAPRSLPRPFMRSLWRAALAGRLFNRMEQRDSIAWLRQAKGGLNATLRIQLRDMLSPRLKLSKPFEWDPELSAADQEPLSADDDDIDWEVVLALPHPWELLVDKLQQEEPWRGFLPSLIDVFALLLREALDLMHELGAVSEQLDAGHLAQASIGAHPQNRRSRDWTALLELTRDAWLGTLAADGPAAQALALSWWRVPYATFKRLALFAATRADDPVLFDTAVEWLLSDGGRWLWEDDLRYEVIRVLVEVAPKVDAHLSARLQEALLRGPPADVYPPDLEPERLRRHSDHAAWLRLSKMAGVDQFLLPEARTFLASMRETYPATRWAKGDRDEFPFWMDATNFETNEDAEGLFGEKPDPLPTDRAGGAEWLQKYPSSPRYRSDDWRKRCSEDFELTSGAISDLAARGIWPRDRWQEALQAWAEPEVASTSWERLSPLLHSAEDEFVQELSRPLARWLQEVASKGVQRAELFEELAGRLLRLNRSGELSTSDPVTAALNHPVGQVVDAYFRRWYASKLRDAQGLASPFREMFTQVADLNVAIFRHGRVFLAKNAVALFRVDRSWSQAHLLALFDWTNEAEAVSAWKGFLWTPQLYWPFLTAIKPAFLETARRYSSLGDHGRQYADLLTFAALDGFDFISAQELSAATRSLTPDGLSDAAHTLARALAGAGNKVGQYWKERVIPYLRQIWPTDITVRSPQVAEAMARLTIAAGDAFPHALALTNPWLMPLDTSDYPVHLLNSSGLASRHPDDALKLLIAIVDVEAFWAPSGLRECLASIADAKPPLKATGNYRQLDEFVRSRQR